MLSFKRFITEQEGYFQVDALVPVGERQTVKRMYGSVDAPSGTNRKQVIGMFISRYTKRVGYWVAYNGTTYNVRWVAPPKIETQQDFGF